MGRGVRLYVYAFPPPGVYQPSLRYAGASPKGELDKRRIIKKPVACSKSTRPMYMWCLVCRPWGTVKSRPTISC